MKTKTLPLSAFLWNKDTRTLVAEASDLQLKCAIPEEIMVRSDVTGKMSLFRNRSIDHDRENDVVSWNYWSSAEKIKLVIFND